MAHQAIHQSVRRHRRAPRRDDGHDGNWWTHGWWNHYSDSDNEGEGDDPDPDPEIETQTPTEQVTEPERTTRIPDVTTESKTAPTSPKAQSDPSPAEVTQPPTSRSTNRNSRAATSDSQSASPVPTTSQPTLEGQSATSKLGADQGTSLAAFNTLSISTGSTAGAVGSVSASQTVVTGKPSIFRLTKLTCAADGSRSNQDASSSGLSIGSSSATSELTLSFIYASPTETNLVDQGKDGGHAVRNCAIGGVAASAGESVRICTSTES